MKFTVRYENIKKPMTLNDFIEKKIIKLEKFNNIGDTLKINILLNKECQYETQIALELLHDDNTLVANEKNVDLYTSIEQCIDNLLSQTIKHKEKRTNH